jgi:bifunctional UDP-N-acetylglucosamine pyrophosphorylase / glucosamine-1-phosphate N-acetyltransferase
VKRRSKAQIKDVVSVVLAAGQYTRMNSAIPKMLHHICGKAIFDYLLSAVRSIGVKRIIVVTGRDTTVVRRALGGDIRTIRQKNMRGTGDAVDCTRTALKGFRGHILVLYSDTPLLTKETLRRLVDKHCANNADCTLLTTVLTNPTGYGRIVRDDRNAVVRIVEEADANRYERAIPEVNAGAYCFRSDRLFEVLSEIAPDNEKHEYYLTDAVMLLAKKGYAIESVLTNDPSEVLGVNTRRELTRAHRIMKDRILERHLSNGVTILDPSTTYIDSHVKIDRDTIIYPFTLIEGKVKIGKSCKVGPFCRVRSGSVIDDNVTLGNFVEVARSRIGRDATIQHHAFLCDCDVREKVNVGVGTYTTQFDGASHSKGGRMVIDRKGIVSKNGRRKSFAKR